MNPPCCVFNPREKVFNPFGFQLALSNDNNDPDIIVYNNKYNAMDSLCFS